MSKLKKYVKPTKSTESLFGNFNLSEILPEKYHLPAVALVILILFMIFLNPMYFGGKTFQSGDIFASKSMVPYVEKERDGFSLWYPHIFCGMPAYGLGTTFPWFNIIALVFTEVRDTFTSLFEIEYTRWTFYLIILGITSFMFMRYITKNLLVSLFTAIATSFSTGIIVFLFIGHVTKLTSLCFYPLIFLLIFRFQEKFRIIDFLSLIVVLQLFIQGFHVQIIFYTLFALGIYYLYFLIRFLFKKERESNIRLIKSGLLLVAGVIISVLISADNLTQIYEYTPYSTRGTVGLVESAQDNTSKTASDYYEYHTNWSFSPEEVMTFIIPSFYGFGSAIYKGPLSNNQEVEVNTYFGQMPFVDVAMYMGVLVFFLALYGVFTRWKEPLVQFLTILASVSLIISFGKNFPVLFDILFYYLPYFDKFRVPSMILVLVQMTLPVLAGLGLLKIIELLKQTGMSVPQINNNKLINVTKYLSYGALGVFVISVLLSGAISGWFTARVSDYASSIQATRPQLAQQFTALSEFMAGMFVTDTILAFAFVAVFFGSVLLYLNKKIGSDLLVIIAIVIVIIDLWRIDSRGAKFVDNPDIEGMYNKPDYISAIESNKDNSPFRMMNLKQDGSLGSFNQNSNYNAYFLQEDFYGYSGIKPRSYQDIIDVVGPVNPTLWNMLNVRYIVTEGKTGIPNMTPIYSTEKTAVWKNDTELGRVYLVNSVDTKTPLEVLQMIRDNSFNPKEKAFIHEGKLSVDIPDSTAYAKVTVYKDELVECEVNASGNNFLFFGSTYVPTGWKARIDNSPVEIQRVNHGFMGIVVPKGKHKVEFIYAPQSFYLSKWIVLILSGIVVLGIIIILVLRLLDNRKKQN